MISCEWWSAHALWKYSLQHVPASRDLGVFTHSAQTESYFLQDHLQAGKDRPGLTSKVCNTGFMF